jgi:serine/threonine protein kinase
MRDDEVEPVLCDFGLAKKIPVNREILYHTSHLSTPHYAAPELKAKEYNHKVDVHAFGVT